MKEVLTLRNNQGVMLKEMTYSFDPKTDKRKLISIGGERDIDGGVGNGG